GARRDGGAPDPPGRRLIALRLAIEGRIADGSISAPVAATPPRKNRTAARAAASSRFPWPWINRRPMCRPARASTHLRGHIDSGPQPVFGLPRDAPVLRCPASSPKIGKAGNIQRCLDAELAFYAIEVFRTGLTF